MTTDFHNEMTMLANIDIDLRLCGDATSRMGFLQEKQGLFPSARNDDDKDFSAKRKNA
jgi:hypothetical protein